MNRVRKVLALTALLAWNASAQVEQDTADIARYVMQENMRRQEQEQQQQQGSAILESARQGGVGGGGSSINPSALQGQGSQNKGKDANDAAGSALMAAGAAMMATPQTMPIGIALMAMGMLAKKQADEDNNAANQSAMTAAASQFGGASGTNGAGTTQVKANPNIANARGMSSIQDPKIKAALKKMEDAGYTVTEQGLHKPDGTLVPASAFNSAGSMAAAGFDPATIRESQKVLGVINEELSKGKWGSMAMSEGSGGGAGGGYSSGSGSPGSESDSFKAFNPFGLGADQKKALIAGKTVLLGGEPIGVRGNNIFEMMHFAYEKRRNGRQFIESEGQVPGPSMRSPASVSPKITGR